MTLLTVDDTESLDEQIEGFDSLFRSASAGEPCWVLSDTGVRAPMPINRWLGGDAASTRDRVGDMALLVPCDGPTLDLGCGPGRLTADLARRGIRALGVDSSEAAIEMTVARGGHALQRSIFDTIPDAGSWRHVLLADGNIGIGGDPLRVLRRARELVALDGYVLAEVDRPGTGLTSERIRWESQGATGGWFDWARVDPAAITDLAGASDLRVVTTVELGGRSFVRLAPITNS
ncbi:methyltransferase domain-containing protein [Actinomycetes bacterium M1A6_2h]